MRRLHLCLYFLLSAFALSAQVSQVEFGKNRVQYHRDFDQWLSYESQNFITYWYGKSRNAGQKAVQIAESVYDEVISTIEFRINDKIELIVYADITDMKQSNIGSEEILSGRSGQTKIERNKVFVYFDGDHRRFREQIREGVTAVFLNYMLFGSEIQEILQNIVALGLPDWFVQGLVSFAGSSWNVRTDDQLRDALSSRKYKSFDQFASDHPLLAGQAFWYYVSLHYGKAEIGNFLYVIRINRNLDNGISFVFGQTYKSLLESTWNFMLQLSSREEALAATLDSTADLKIRNRRNAPVTALRLHPSQPLLAYASNDLGRIRVYLKDLESGRNKLIFTRSYRNSIQETDYNYPLITWSPDGHTLGIMYEFRDEIFWLSYDIRTGKKEKLLMPNRFQRIYSVDFWDANTLVLTASENNFSDLYLFRLRNRQSDQLTNDIYDDKYAVTGSFRGQKGIFFASDRDGQQKQQVSSDSIIPLDPLNLYFRPVGDKAGSDTLFRISRSGADHTAPVFTADGKLYYLSNESGLVAREMLDLAADNDLTARTVTRYPRNLMAHHAVSTNGQYVESLVYKGKPRVYTGKLADQPEAPAYRTMFRDVFKTQAEASSRELPSNATLKGIPQRNTILKPILRDTIRETNPDYFFQTEFGDPSPPKDSASLAEIMPPQLSGSENVRVRPQQRYERINPLRVVPYRLKFRIDYVTTTVDNNPLFGGLESYAGTGNVLYNNPLGLLFKTNIKDLFEDYQLEGGIRIPTAFNGAEYFILLDDKKRRLDKRYAIYRRATYRNEGFLGSIPIRSRTEILLGQYELRYPLDVFTSLRASATLRQDRFTLLASERSSLEFPSEVDQRAGVRVEFVFDNTMTKDLNLMNGTRYKIYTEWVKRFQVQFLDRFRFDLGQGYMGIVGLDARHYQPLGKHIVLAVRAAAATSFGSEKILYLLGGVDNWLIPRFNNNIPLPDAESFAYQVLAPNVRGFEHNIRNGNSFALINAEVRVPVFKLFIKRPIRSNFLRHFQMVGFMDVGTAWQGISPFNRDNPLNTIIIENPPTVTVKVNYFRDPIVMGYGLGVRTMIFGYFIRADYGWGIETKEVLPPRFHLAMGLDF